ncbi:MAG: Crp/Fnr family transcriptional regulator [Ardenticatenaceae bacterium]|nr:Crp/Fnr family transcriptional regulator [Anaerolineales bacterium]MCB8989236.1 Crp/Fnr family transcriptional regulator [Ardenticatenaceae bacterium]
MEKTISRYDDTILNRCNFFKGLSKHEITAVLKAARIVNIPSNSFFFHQGEEAISFYIVVSGQVRLSQINPEGRQVIVHIFGPGDAIGIIVALSNMTYPVSAEAMTDTQALGWDRDTIAYLMEECPRLAVNGLHLIAHRFMELQDRYRELATERVERRIARALLRQAQQRNGRIPHTNIRNIALSRQDLAEMTGTTLYTVSRTCSSWEQEGIVTAGRGYIEINNFHKLLVIAEDLPDSHQCHDPQTCYFCPPDFNCNTA